MAFSFTVKKREEGKVSDVSEMRKKGLIPGVLYGGEAKPVSLTIDYVSFAKLYNEAGESSLIDFKVGDSAPVKVLIHELQYDPIKGKITHVDFRQINMNKEMHATVELVFIGESPAVKGLGGTLIKNLDSVEIKCLPKDLVSEIQVDLSVLNTFEDVIHVKDLKVPTGISISDDLEQVIAKVAAPLTEEELKAMEEATAPAIDQIEVEKKGKEEVAEGAEGEKKVEEGKKEEKKKE